MYCCEAKITHGLTKEIRSNHLAANSRLANLLTRSWEEKAGGLHTLTWVCPLHPVTEHLLMAGVPDRQLNNQTVHLSKYVITLMLHCNKSSSWNELWGSSALVLWESTNRVQALLPALHQVTALKQLLRRPHNIERYRKQNKNPLRIYYFHS